MCTRSRRSSLRPRIACTALGDAQARWAHVAARGILRTRPRVPSGALDRRTRPQAPGAPRAQAPTARVLPHAPGAGLGRTQSRDTSCRYVMHRIWRRSGALALDVRGCAILRLSSPRSPAIRPLVLKPCARGLRAPRTWVAMGSRFGCWRPAAAPAPQLREPVCSVRPGRRARAPPVINA